VTDIAVEREGDHVGVARLQRPPHNFFDTALLAALADAYADLASNGWCRAIVLASQGRNFCAGLDFAGNGDQDIAALYAEAVRLFAAPLPVVAAVQGAAVGGGFGLALSADFRVATPSSRFSANFSRLAFHHGFALSVTLPLVVGPQHAADLLYTGRRVGGEEALAIGLCDELVDDDELLPAALRRASAIAAAGPLAVRSIRATLRQGRVEAVERALAHECAEQERLRSTADFAEGVAATAERRTPRFTGH
jgi:2-(1,2-epoxy-1,2-dihydrophenyl)acetyl-CoA isomerase